ncbi:universal stress protein [Bradyrhizobium pachyrhizi]|uniref:universal stress protein n=1 Tax=Bradyrhizobium pachyrhizi TaxID=280333 RepID=UPI0024B24341|nr:universal stress protein [Bradyrhizobium pachyrhizi]WFU58379.1 universal stress protein [Bradyrhizobium pachyrhizi]
MALRLNGQPNEPRGLIEELLYGAGRHLLLIPEDEKTMAPLDHVVVAWNGSRESARSLSESLSCLQRARNVWLLVVEYERPAQTDTPRSNDAAQHLRHHGIDAVKYRAVGEDDEIADIVIEECRRLDADLLVMAAMATRACVFLPGCTTSRLLHHSPVPLVIAH